jgi:hypothetical protein
VIENGKTKENEKRERILSYYDERKRTQGDIYR